ncbi:MAG TPA: Rid family detoxifying hydrolase [Anaerolineales bacterium]
MKKAVMVAQAAKAIGPYSHAVIANGFVFVSGQGPFNPQTGTASPAFSEQARQVFENIKTILEGVGLGLDDVVKVNAYLLDLANFQEFNQVYRTYFSHDFPVRTTVSCALPGTGAQVEVDCIAAVRE